MISIAKSPRKPKNRSENKLLFAYNEEEEKGVKQTASIDVKKDIFLKWGGVASTEG